MAIPTLRAVDHVGYTVPDIEAAVAFFVDVLGGELVFYAGPFTDTDDGWMPAHLDVEPGTSLRLAMVRMGADTNVELFQYYVSDQNLTPPRNSDVSGRHIALYVDDLHAAIEYMRAVPGVRILGEPTLNLPPSPNAGSEFVYFQAPWGMYFELISYPGGQDYETMTDKRLKPLPATWSTTAVNPAG
jgi:catechol 2,3-dioxygenase-like lactoylglutathione lyase family enzyme